ncbi:MAG TPA: ribbon-helix-helix domain-containing protein [Geminicoccaceae bacterium]|nr:ribbon-helix-helix domain-containing protein [Geminicoccaceae bacterium]
MSRKRTSLDAILKVPEPAPAPAAPVEPAPARVFKQQTVYLPVPVYEQLRRLAFEERVKMHSLLMEGLDRVFRDRGLPGVEDLKGRAA